MSFNEQRIQRRKWTDEERKNTLISCGSKCARCGKKLNMKTLTMEHVVPISKGGENIENNLVVLCQPCNSRKADKFCWPGGYYVTLDNNSKLSKVVEYTEDWAYNNLTTDTIVEFPMMSQVLSMTVGTGSIVPKTFVPQLVFNCYELNESTLKPYLDNFNLTFKDCIDTVPMKDNLYSIIGVESYSGTKLALYTMQCYDGAIVISEVYSTSSKSVGSILPASLLSYLMHVYHKFGYSELIVRARNMSSINYLFEMYQYGAAKTKVRGTYSYGSYLQDGCPSWCKDWKYKDCLFAFTVLEGFIGDIIERDTDKYGRVKD